MRKIRIIIAAVFFVGITLLLLGIGQQWWAWMAKLQFLPSCFALNLAVIVGVLLVTIVLGRVYCSVICPLGILQDIVSKFNKKKKFKFSPERTWLRYGILAAAVISVIAFGQVGISLIAPYSAYGRIVAAICTTIAGSVESALIIVAAVTLLLVGLCAFFYGRIWCNTICPVGSILGLFSRFSLFRIVIDESKCINCGVCAKKCKCACIDPKEHKVDMSRCVVCLNCPKNCKVGAISYRFAGLPFGIKSSKGCSQSQTAKPASVSDTAKANLKHESKSEASQQKLAETQTSTPAIEADKGRRNFLVGAAVILGSGISAKAQNVKKHLDGGLAEITPKETPEREFRIVPPGAQSIKNFYDHCTSCQLCVNNCPNDILHPSKDIEHFLQPQIDYKKGYCRPECTICSTICPSGAILPLKPEEKLNIRIGVAKVNLALCLAANEEAACGNCVRHCPTGALRMLRADNHKFTIPVVAEEQCIGCGACEYLCPSRPISAITVDGLSVHHSK